METITNGYPHVSQPTKRHRPTRFENFLVFHSDHLRSQRRRTVPSWYIAVPLKVVKPKAFLMADEARPIRRLSEATDGDRGGR